MTVGGMRRSCVGGVLRAEADPTGGLGVGLAGEWGGQYGGGWAGDQGPCRVGAGGVVLAGMVREAWV